MRDSYSCEKINKRWKEIKFLHRSGVKVMNKKLGVSAKGDAP